MTFSFKTLTAFLAVSILGSLSFVLKTEAQTSKKSAREPSPNQTTLTIPSNPKVGDSIRNSIGMELAWIPSGSFMMGSTSAQVDEAWAECKKYLSSCERSSFFGETPQRLVTLRQGFWMGRHEVTQGQYEAVMGTNPSFFKNCGKDCPVERVSWNKAKEFIKRLNDRNDGFGYSLPTEAEWEYAARAGTTTAFAFGNSLSSTQANFNGNYPYGNAARGPYLQRTTKVGSYRPNAWGLYDMHGNVWEWVEDIYQDSYTGLPTDGSANTTRGDSSRRVLRGGSWGSYGNGSRSAFRGGYSPAGVNNGFRVVARAR
jgi:formylglycine-generating enzyme required for sulfatase activity